MKQLVSLVLLLVISVQLVACNLEEVNESVPESEKRIFVDDCGREVEIPEEIQSYVSTGPLAQIILFGIAPDEMAGLSSKWNESASGIVAETYLKLPYLGQLYGSADLNLEELASVGPDVIIDIGEIKESTVSDLNKLQEQTGIPAVFISSDMKTMPDTYRRLGELLGKEEKAEELALFCERTYQRTEGIMENVGQNKKNGIFVVGDNGLHVLAKSAYQAEIFDFLVNNLAVVESPLSKGTGNEVTMEQIALWNPEFILFGTNGVYGTVKHDAAWSQMDAVQNESYIEVPEGPHNWMGSPPAVQQYLGLIWLTAQLYPEYCDYDMKTEILEYYRLFYGCELTDTQFDTLTKQALLG